MVRLHAFTDTNKLLLTKIHHSHDCAWHYPCKGKGRSAYTVTQSLSSTSLLFLKMQPWGEAKFGGLLCTAWHSTTGSINPIPSFLYTGLAWPVAPFPFLLGPTLLPSYSADQSALRLSLPVQGKEGTCGPVPKPFLCFFPLSLPKPPLSNESNLGSLQLPGLPSLSALTQCCGKCHSTKVICKSARERVAGGHCLCLSFQSAEGWICF